MKLTEMYTKNSIRKDSFSETSFEIKPGFGERFSIHVFVH